MSFSPLKACTKHLLVVWVLVGADMFGMGLAFAPVAVVEKKQHEVRLLHAVHAVAGHHLLLYPPLLRHQRLLWLEPLQTFKIDVKLLTGLVDFLFMEQTDCGQITMTGPGPCRAAATCTSTWTRC